MKKNAARLGSEKTAQKAARAIAANNTERKMGE